MVQFDVPEEPKKTPSRARRAALTQKPAGKLHHRKLITEDVLQGRIFWLPPKDKVLKLGAGERLGSSAEPVWNHSTLSIPDKSFFGHPILIVSRRKDCPNIVSFVKLTTFGGRSLVERYHGHQRRYWPDYLPIAPSIPHPLFIKGDKDFRRLHLAPGSKLKRKGYVSVQKVHDAQWNEAEFFWPGGDSQSSANQSSVEDFPLSVTRLSEESMAVVLAMLKKRLKYEPGEQYRC